MAEQGCAALRVASRSHVLDPALRTISDPSERSAPLTPDATGPNRLTSTDSTTVRYGDIIGQQCGGQARSRARDTPKRTRRSSRARISVSEILPTMATPPRITDRERDAALARITARHHRIDDPRRSELGTEPRDVISYVLDRGRAGIPRRVASADHHDALILSTWCWWEERRRERRLLRQGVHLGLSASELGAPLGMRSRQGLRDRLDRLDALLTHDRPDEGLTRAARRAARAADTRQYWIDTHRAQVRATLAALLAQTRRLLEAANHHDQNQIDPGEGDDLDAADASVGEWAEELEGDYTDDALSPATLAVAGLLSAELRTHPRLQVLDPRHRLHAVLRGVDELRARHSTALAEPTTHRADDGGGGGPGRCAGR